MIRLWKVKSNSWMSSVTALLCIPLPNKAPFHSGFPFTHQKLHNVIDTAAIAVSICFIPLPLYLFFPFQPTRLVTSLFHLKKQHHSTCGFTTTFRTVTHEKVVSTSSTHDKPHYSSHRFTCFCQGLWSPRSGELLDLSHLSSLQNLTQLSSFPPSRKYSHFCKTALSWFLSHLFCYYCSFLLVSTHLPLL